MTEPAIIGAVLAGGRGRRIGRDKATVDLNGRPLISYPIGALRAAGLDVVLALRNGQAAPRGIINVGVYTTSSRTPGRWPVSTRYSRGHRANGFS